MNNQQYTCPRCGYASNKSSNFRNHLYKRQRQCPIIVNDVELTNDIKEYLMANRIYKVKERTKKTDGKKDRKIVQNITNNTDNSQKTNNNNNINYNVYINLDPGKKMEYYHKSINNQLETIDDLIFRIYENDIKKMNDNDGDYSYTITDFIDIVDNVIRSKDVEHKDCVLVHERKESATACYNQRQEKPSIYPEWELLEKEKSANIIVGIIQHNLWNTYELYLLQKIERYKNAETIKYLLIYYTFLSSFDLKPYVHHVSCDSEILYNQDEEEYSHYSSDTLKRKYIEIYEKNNTPMMEMGRTAIYHVVKILIANNGSHSISSIDKKIQDVLIKDPSYQMNR